MTPELAKAALYFLDRVDLNGTEVPLFMQVRAALDAVANSRPAPEKPTKETPIPGHERCGASTDRAPRRRARARRLPKRNSL